MKVCSKCDSRFDRLDSNCPACHSGPRWAEGYPSFLPEQVETIDGFKMAYFSQLAAVESGNFWFRSRNRLIMWALRRYFPKPVSFFEIGCGTGFVLSGIESEFPNLILFGSDLYTEALAYATGRLRRAELFQMDAREIPFENEFNVIGAFDVLEHVGEDDIVLKQMHQAVRPGGGVILTVPQHQFLWSKIDEYACHVRRYNKRELRTKVEKAGFKVLRMTSFVSLLLPLMAASRFKRRRGQYDPISELKLNKSINIVLEKALDIERILIRLGIDFPMGGSLLLIGRKN
jgi:SAM-dependent methyltransferase